MIKVKIENIEDELGSFSSIASDSSNYNTKSAESLNKVINGGVCVMCIV